MNDDLTLEKLRVVNKLDDLAVKVAELSTEIVAHQKAEEQMMARMEKASQRMEKCVYGNGKEGLVTRVDRNSRGLVTISRVVWITVVAVIGVIARRLFGG